MSHWWYTYSRKYGSPKVNETAIKPSSVILSADKKSLEIKVDLIEKKVYGFDFSKVKSATDQELANKKAFYTLVKKQ